jgi:hypothetical protein
LLLPAFEVTIAVIGEDDRAADLEGGVQQAGSEALLVVGDPVGRLHVQRRQARRVADPAQHHRRQDRADVRRRFVDPQEHPAPFASSTT